MQHDIQTDKQRRLDEALAQIPVELTADLTPAATAPTATRRKSSKARRDLQTTIGQIDNLFPALADKPSKQADILCEKASAIKTLLALETEERETEQDIRLKELEAGHEADSRRIAELTAENTRLQTLASTRQVVTVGDPNHAAVKEERDALQSIVALLATLLDSVTEDARAETAVRVAQSCKCRRVVELFCKLTHIDCGNLNGYLSYTESALSALRGSQTAKDSNVVLARAVLAVKYPAPVKNGAPAFIPDTRSADEKLRDAKAQTRQSWQ